jgi:hypothetical protein
VVYGNLTSNFSPIRRKNCNCMLYPAKGDVMIAERPACAPPPMQWAEVAKSLGNSGTRINRFRLHSDSEQSRDERG